MNKVTLSAVIAFALPALVHAQSNSYYERPQVVDDRPSDIDYDRPPLAASTPNNNPSTRGADEAAGGPGIPVYDAKNDDRLEQINFALVGLAEVNEDYQDIVDPASVLIDIIIDAIGIEEWALVDEVIGTAYDIGLGSDLINRVIQDYGFLIEGEAFDDLLDKMYLPDDEEAKTIYREMLGTIFRSLGVAQEAYDTADAGQAKIQTLQDEIGEQDTLIEALHLNNQLLAENGKLSAILIRQQSTLGSTDAQQKIAEHKAEQELVLGMTAIARELPRDYELPGAGDETHEE